MRQDDVRREEMSDVLMEREAEVDVTERERREETEMDEELPDISMSVRLRLPSV